MSYHIQMTARATEQVLAVVEYIAYTLLEPESATRWYDTLTDTIDTLADFPGRFRLVDYEPWRSRGLRQMVVQNYNVYFWVDEDSQTVMITAVLYYRQNALEALLNMPLS